MLSLTCKNAIKAVIYLASKYDSDTKAGIKEIAEYINASDHTVGKLLQTLVKHEIINSLKGPSGGFYISRDQLKQPVINIVQAIDGDEVFRECGLGLKKCSAKHPCPLHDQYKEARDILEKMFRKNSVKDLSESVNDGLAYLTG
ncbi:RrF2 family transcriptional regulator [Flavihumibacter petaseus]|uniref:Putative Rrf2 family transcriptional regulator n=1 Tax=Flavihumibacter petaseus NBRC 106054 TaxID=1220578 RepID=A0A0E9MYM5_9BACT|nr:Rrf2 family transcriptional regulator [Flavihumibacter petaseus]GAO42694.1 putative Rrf2 family transcriptional regulator [Flavihumibacter petaseus NBRC 106054]